MSLLIFALATLSVIHTVSSFPFTAATATPQSHHKLLQFIENQRLTNIHNLQYRNVTELYVRVLELSQTLNILQESLSDRSCYDATVVPPYCVIPERAADDSVSDVESIEQLTEDVYMLANLTSYLERATDYEDDQHCGQYTELLMQPAKEMLDEIIAALLNVTGAHLSEPFGGTFYNDTDTESSAGETSTTENSASSKDRCGGAMTDEYQFADVFELMLAVWYTRNDLNYIRQQLKN